MFGKMDCIMSNENKGCIVPRGQDYIVSESNRTV